MPIRAPRACSYQGCPDTTITGGRCAKHRSEQYRRIDEARRDDGERAFYRTTRWRVLRAHVLDRETMCRECERYGAHVPAIDVDHIVPRRSGGTDSIDNLQPLCRRCHAAKTMREMNAARRAR